MERQSIYIIVSKQRNRGQGSRQAVMLTVKNVTLQFGGLKAVNDVSINVEKGKISGLIGPNGAGKTTFFNLISGVYKPDSGTIFFNGERIDGKKPYQINS